MSGFLSAVPHGSKKPRSESWTTHLPEPGELMHLWQWVRQMGVTIGGHALTFAEIKAWSELTGILPTPDESTALAELSRIWLSEFNRGRDPDAFPPWLPE
jgi:hypothetical protein